LLQLIFPVSELKRENGGKEREERKGLTLRMSIVKVDARGEQEEKRKRCNFREMCPWIRREKKKKGGVPIQFVGYLFGG